MFKSKKFLNLLVGISMLSLGVVSAQVALADTKFETNSSNNVDNAAIEKKDDPKVFAEKQKKANDLINYVENLQFKNLEGKDREYLEKLNNEIKQLDKKFFSSKYNIVKFTFQNMPQTDEEVEKLSSEDMQKLLDVRNFFSYLVSKKLKDNNEFKNLVEADEKERSSYCDKYDEMIELIDNYSHKTKDQIKEKSKESREKLRNYWKNRPIEDKIHTLIGMYYLTNYDITTMKYQKEKGEKIGFFNNFLMSIHLKNDINKYVSDAIDSVKKDIKDKKVTEKDLEDFKKYTAERIKFSQDAPKVITTKEIINNLSDDEKINQLEHVYEFTKLNKKYIQSFKNLATYNDEIEKRRDENNKRNEQKNRYIDELKNKINSEEDAEKRKVLEDELKQFEIFDKRITEGLKDSLKHLDEKEFEGKKIEGLKALIKDKEILDDIAKYRESKDENLKNKLLKKFDEHYKYVGGMQEKYKEEEKKEMDRLNDINYNEIKNLLEGMNTISVEDIPTYDNSSDYDPLEGVLES